MVEHLAHLPVVEVEVSNLDHAEREDRDPDEDERNVSMAVGLEGVVSELVAVGLVVGVGLVLDQVRVGVGREDVLVARNNNRLLQARRLLTGREADH